MSGVRIYATVDDFTDFLDPDPVPANASRMLREASREVEDMTLTAFYETDTNGYPTDAEVIEAFRDATCAQAEFARASGDSNSVGANQYHSVSIGSVQLTRGYDPGGSVTPARWSRKAWQILKRAGLVAGEPWSQ